MDTPALSVQQTALEKKIKIGEEHSTGTDRYECVQISVTHARTHPHLHVAIFVSKKYAAVRLLEKIAVDGSDVETTNWLADRQTKRQTGLEESDTDIQNLFFILTKDGCTKLIPMTQRPTQLEGGSV